MGPSGLGSLAAAIQRDAGNRCPRRGHAGLSMGPEQTSDRAHMGEASLVWYQRLRHGQGMLRKPTSHVVGASQWPLGREHDRARCNATQRGAT